MRKIDSDIPLYCDGTCCEKKLMGTWTKTRKGARFCTSHQKLVNECEYCGKTFHSNRVQTSTCSNACRMAKSRAKRLQIESVT